MNKSSKNKTFLITGLVFIVASLCFVLYPTVSNAVNNYFSAATINNYTTSLDNISAADRADYFSAADKYNKNLREMVNGFSYSTDSLIDGYDDILNFGDGLIGYIEIKTIDVKLPIYHGDTDKVLEKGVAHIPNTAFPTGGVGNHSVLSAHTGFPTQVFFDNLNEVEIGDIIKVSVLDETLTYKVTAKNIVEPTDISLLSVDDSKDLLSLITCYPYGVNSHRLIVTAEYADKSDENNITVQDTDKILDSSGSPNLIFIIFTVISMTIISVIVIVAVYKKGRKKNAQ